MLVSQNQPGVHKYQIAQSELQPEMNFSHKAKKLMHVVNTFQMWNRPPKFSIDLEADWLNYLTKFAQSPGLSRNDH